MSESDDHRHCKVCGKVCEPEKETCSKVCRLKREETVAARKRYTFVLYALIAFTLVIFLLFSVHL